MHEIEGRGAVPAGKGSVAVIDDDDAARMSIGQMLKLRRYEVALFASAEAALASPRLLDMDCIVTDVKMPGMDGETFLAEVMRQGYACPVVMITGHGDVSMAVRCLKSVSYTHLTLPTNREV